MFAFGKRCKCTHLGMEHEIIVAGVLEQGECRLCHCPKFTVSEQLEQVAAAVVEEPVEVATEEEVFTEEAHQEFLAEERLRQRLYADEGYIEEIVSSVRHWRLYEANDEYQRVKAHPDTSYYDEWLALIKVQHALRSMAKEKEGFKEMVYRWWALICIAVRLWWLGQAIRYNFEG